MSDRFQDLMGVRVVRQFDQADRETQTGYGEEVAVSLDHVVPGSKAKYYFPDDEVDTYGRDVPNPYRRMADRNALGHIERG